MYAFPQLRWDPTMATGFAEADAQHQRLFAMFNAAARSQADGGTHDATEALLAELLDYTREHFRAETDLMRQWPVDAGRRARHLAAHQRFSSFVAQACDIAREQPDDLMPDLLGYLAQWLLHHVATVDRQLADEIHALAAGEPPPDRGDEADAAAPARLADAVEQLTDTLVQRSFTLLRQRQQLTNLERLYRALLHSSDVLIQSRSERDMLDGLCSKIVEQTPFHAAWIGHPADDTGMFDVLAKFGAGTGQVDAARPRLTPDYRSSMTVRAWTGQELLYSNDTLADAQLAPWHAGLALHCWRSALAVPIRRDGRIWAVLTLASPRRHAFDEATVEVCRRIAAVLGHGLDELDLKARIQSLQSSEAALARTDLLTGLPNRLALDEYVQQAIHRAQRNASPLCIGLLDLDDFKLVNDQHGHDAGDALLRAFGARVRETMRASDFCARLGGDEFVVVFDGLSAPTQIEAALQHLHGTVEQPFALGDARSAMVGLTAGVACFPGDGANPRDLLRAADSAMYQAKLRKRGRSAWWRFASSAAPAD